MGKIMKSGIPYGGGGSGANSVSDLTDVEITNLADGDTLQYDSTENKWKNEKGGSAFDLNNAQPTFDEASERVNIASGEKVSVILGKIKKFFADLKPVAFSGSYSDLSNTPSIPTVPSASTSLPLEDGNATVGVSSSYARADHVHPAKSLPTATSSVLGGVKIGENMTIEDGVINPSYLVVANKFNKADLYSTTEKVVGCWTDGKPLYQKTFISTMPSNDGGFKTISIGANIDKAFVKEFVINNATYKWSKNGTALFTDSRDFGSQCYINTNGESQSPNVIKFNSFKDTLVGLDVYITVQYTKTTDSANSFKYADENDYSTSEKIVGTWIDGSLIYQKTISFGALPNATSKNVAHGISNISRIVSIVGYAYRSSSVKYLPLPFVSANEVGESINISADNTNISILTGYDRSAFTESYVTLQYTKTS